MVKKLMLCVAVAAVMAGAPALAQQPEPVKRTVLQKNDFPGDKMSTLVVLIEIAPNFVVAKHTHPGIETGYLLEGEADLIIEGKPVFIFSGTKGFTFGSTRVSRS